MDMPLDVPFFCCVLLIWLLYQAKQLVNVCVLKNASKKWQTEETEKLNLNKARDLTYIL